MMGKCKDCKYWHRPDEWAQREEDGDDAPWLAYGVCDGFKGTEMISLYVNGDNLGDDVGEDARVSLATRKDFGCVLYAN